MAYLDAHLDADLAVTLPEDAVNVPELQYGAGMNVLHWAYS